MNDWKAKPSPAGLAELYPNAESPAWTFAYDAAMGRAAKRAEALARTRDRKAIVQVKSRPDGVEVRLVVWRTFDSFDIIETQMLPYDDFFERRCADAG